MQIPCFNLAKVYDLPYLYWQLLVDFPHLLHII